MSAGGTWGAGEEEEEYCYAASPLGVGKGRRFQTPSPVSAHGRAPVTCQVLSRAAGTGAWVAGVREDSSEQDRPHRASGLTE